MNTLLKKLFSFFMVLFMCISTFSLYGGVESVYAYEDSSDLKSFVSSADIQGATQGEDGKTILYPGQEYTVAFKFNETEKLQMKLNSSNSLTYDFPSQLDPTDTTQAQNFNIRVNSGGTNYDVPATYSISSQKLTVTIDTNSSNYNYLSNAQNVEIQLNIAAVFNSNNNSEEIDFGNNVKKEVTVHSNATLVVDKKLSEYDEATGKFHYTVTVKSNGYSKNVVVTDSITGTALIYDDNSLSVTSSTDRTVTSTSTDTQKKWF